MGLEAGKLILVDGATGYLGNHLVSKLKEEGYLIRCLIHSGSNKIDVDYLKTLTDDIQEVDFTKISPDNSAHIFDSVYCLVHLIGSIAPKKGETLSQLHRELTSKLISTGMCLGLNKVVHVTACGASGTAQSEYHKTKWLAEEVVRNSGIEYKILRPSLILGRAYGNRDSKLVKRLLKFIKTRPFVPLVNGGHNKVQPIFVLDVVAAIIASIESENDSATLEIGGQVSIEMKDLVTLLATRFNKKSRVLALNDKLGTFVATVMENLQEVPVLSRDQVVLSLTDNVCQTNSFENLVGRPPTPLEEVVKTYEDAYLQTI